MYMYRHTLKDYAFREVVLVISNDSQGTVVVFHNHRIVARTAVERRGRTLVINKIPRRKIWLTRTTTVTNALMKRLVRTGLVEPHNSNSINLCLQEQK